MKNKQKILERLHSDPPLFLHFYTMDCKKQKAIKSALKKLKKSQPKAFVDTMNIEITKQPKLVEKLEIEGVPTVMLYVRGQEKWRKAGEVSEEQMLEALSRFINAN